jgi:hypothetical protein
VVTAAALLPASRAASRLAVTPSGPVRLALARLAAVPAALARSTAAPAALARSTAVPAALAWGAAPAGGIPVVGRGAGQRLARAELSKSIYHPQPSLTARVVNFLLTWLNRLFHDTQALPGGWWGFVALAALAGLAAAVVLGRIGPVARARRRVLEPGSLARARTAQDHRAAATRLAEAGDYAAAICERVRAIAAELDERGVLAPRIGRTADEFAAEAGRAMPPHAADLLGAARLFDEVRYGQRPGTRPGYDLISSLDTRIGASAGRRGARAPVQAGTGTP